MQKIEDRILAKIEIESLKNEVFDFNGFIQSLEVERLWNAPLIALGIVIQVGRFEQSSLTMRSNH